MEDPIHYWDYSPWKITPSSVKDQMAEVDVDVSRVRPYYVQSAIPLTNVLHNSSQQSFY